MENRAGAFEDFGDGAQLVRRMSATTRRERLDEAQPLDTIVVLVA